MYTLQQNRNNGREPVYYQNRDGLRSAPSQPERTPDSSRYGFNGEPLSLPRDRVNGRPRRTRTDNSIEFPTQQRRPAQSGTGRSSAPQRQRSAQTAQGTRRSGQSARQQRGQAQQRRTARPQQQAQSQRARQQQAQQRYHNQRLRPAETAVRRDPQRREMSKKRKMTRKAIRRRRIMGKLMAFALLLGVIVAGGYLTMTMLFKISTIQVQAADGSAVQTAGGYTSDQILQALGVHLEENIFSFDPGSRAAALEKQFPLLESIKVERQYPSTVVVRVTEAVPTYAMHTESGWLTLSDQFKILDCSSVQPTGLCTLYGGEPVSSTPGDQLSYDAPQQDASGAASASAASAEPDGRLAALTELRSKLEEYGLLADVTRIEFADTEEMAFLYQDRVSILLGTLNELDYKLDRARYVLNNEDGKGCAPTDTGRLDFSHISASSIRKIYFAQGEPTLPSGYVVPPAVQLSAEEPAAEDEASADSTADTGAEAAADELPLTDPARMTANEEEDPM